MSLVIKACKRCGMLKEKLCFYKHGGMRDGHLNICIECVKEYQKHSRSDATRIRDKNRYYQNKKKRLDSLKLSRSKRPNLYKEFGLRHDRKRLIELRDSYIRSLLVASGAENPSINMIKEKRFVVQIKRIINEKQRQINSSRSS